MNINKNFRYFFFFLVGIFILKWVFDFFDVKEAIELINQNKTKLYLVILAHVPTLFFDSLAWYFLIKKKTFSLIWSILITWIAQTSGKFLPTGNVTGEFVKIYLGIKKGLSSHESSSTVFADLILATFSLFLMAFFSLIYVLLIDFDLFQSKGSIYIYISLLLISLGCLFFYLLVKNRLLIFMLRKIHNIFGISLSKNKILFILRLDISLFNLIKRKKLLFKVLFTRLLGWVAGAFEIFIFLSIIGVEVSFLDVILIEAFSGIIRSVAFFIPAGIGVQELAFVVIGDYVGLSSSVSFSIAIGRRIREILVGIPAIGTWFYFFGKSKESKKGSSK